MTFKQKYGPVALVAGASEGLGEAFARGLAARGFDLVLVARRKEQLEKVSADIASQYKIKVIALCIDLGREDSTDQIRNAIGNTRINCLVYNAASSHIGRFLDISLFDHEQMIAVNNSTPLKLVHCFGKTMVEDGRGCILLMSSLAGLQGSGYLATYAASKSFLKILAEGLWYEWKSKGVDVMACCAGAIATPAYFRTLPNALGFPAPKPQKAEAVVEECFKKMGSSPSFISGKGNRMASFFMQYIFRGKRAIRIMGNATRLMYGIGD